MRVRVSLPLTLVASDGSEGVAGIDRFGAEVPGWLRFGCVKLFMDGVDDTETTLTVTDYPGRPGFRPAPLIAPTIFNAICVEADRRGLQVATHAAGDVPCAQPLTDTRHAVLPPWAAPVPISATTGAAR